MKSNNKFYSIDIYGQKIDLPIIKVKNDLAIAFFNLHGNVGLVEHCGRHLSKLVDTSVQILLTAESKGIALTHSLSCHLNLDKFVVARKTKKIYMDGGISENVKTIATKNKQQLFLSAYDVALLKNKNVAIVDDVISTGNSVVALENLVEKAGGIVVQKLAVLAEGDAKNRTDITYLNSIPFFTNF